MKALLLEDDVILSSEISLFLESKFISTDKAEDGEIFLEKFQKKKYDIYLLDINVPKINGLEVCKKIRSVDSLTPIIIISAYDGIEEKKAAFSHAADDYLVKPFLLEELQLRVNNLLRRTSMSKEEKEKIVIADLIIYPQDGTVFRSGEEITLTVKEFQLLEILVRANGRVVSKQYISDEVWKNQFQSTNNAIEVYINFLRKKIDKNHSVKLIHTRPGFGYYISSN